MQLNRLEVIIHANRKGRIQAVITDPATNGTEIKEFFPVTPDAQTIRLDGAFQPGSRLDIYDEDNNKLFSQIIASPQLSSRALPFKIASVAFFIIAGMLVLALLLAWYLAWRRRYRRTNVPAQTHAYNAVPTADSGFRIESELASLRGRLTALESTARQEPVTNGANETRPSELESVVRLLAPPAATKSIARGSSPSPEEVMLAAVNLWIGDEPRDRSELLRLISPAGIDARFYGHGDAAATLRDPTNFIYPFEPADRDGGWLWVDLPSGESLAVPADTAFFKIGKAPDLLERLFDGMRNAPDSFRYRTFYRACRLRRAPQSNGYALVEKGRVLLDKMPLPRDWTAPATYGEIQPRLGRRPNRVADVNLVAVSGGAAQVLANYLNKMTDSIAELESKAYQQPRVKSLSEADIENLVDAKIESAKGDTAGLIRGLKNEFVPLKRSADESANQVENFARRLQNLETLVRTASDSVPVPPSQVRLTAAGVGLAGLSDAVSDQKPLPAPMEAAVGWQMPQGWQEAVTRAFSSDAMSAEYPERLRSLFSELRALNGSLVRLVHLKPKDADFELHDVADNAPELQCQLCQSTKTNHFAVCVGESVCSKAGLLFPLGPYIYFDDPELYFALFQGVPNGAFRITAISSPARLERSGFGAFQVSAQMQCQFG